MSNEKSYLHEAFLRVAKNGILGDPLGIPAYAYARVSSDEQADEDRSGLPRQLQHIHEIALEKGLRISWELTYMDDFTGFEFQTRPALSQLRKEYASKNRKANFVVMEYLDRLSRHADWHQGYLLDEMRQYNLEVVFWKAYNSRVERAVFGAIAQDGMEQAKQRMMDGVLFKARSGRVTSRWAAYGYKIVDSQGEESPKARKDSHYAVVPEEAAVVRIIFEGVASGDTLRGIAAKLQGLYPPPKNMANWHHKNVSMILKNPVYKGEFIAHRYRTVKVPRVTDDLLGTTVFVSKRIEYPKEDWIRVAVPPIVDETLWEIANEVLKANKKVGSRNSKEQYLLSGLLKCGKCGYAMHGLHRFSKKQGKYYIGYRCGTKSRRVPGVSVACSQPQINAVILDAAVWHVISDLLLHPEKVIAAMDEEFKRNTNAQALEQISVLEGSKLAIDADDKRLWKAYTVGAFDAYEFATRRKELKVQQAAIDAKIEELRSIVLAKSRMDKQKRYILAVAEMAKEYDLSQDVPFEIKKRIIKTLVEEIHVYVEEGWFELRGVIKGQWVFREDNEKNGSIMGVPDCRVAAVQA